MAVNWPIWFAGSMSGRRGSAPCKKISLKLPGRSSETHGKNYKYDFSYEEIGGLIRKHVAAYPVEMERFFRLVVFNYFVQNGDAHLKNFSVIRNEQYGDYTLTPAYDLLNTRLHVPNETRTASAPFRYEDEFETDSFKANAFYAYDDFRELAIRLGLRETRIRRIMQAFIDGESAVFSLIDRSGLSEECKQLYKEHVRDSIKVLSYSYAGFR